MLHPSATIIPSPMPMTDPKKSLLALHQNMSQVIFGKKETLTLALVTHSTKPRGGLVHTLGLAEQLHRLGHPVHLVMLGDPAVGLFRPTSVPHTVLPAPARGGSLEQRVFASIGALTAGLAELAGGLDILHAQDCIAARCRGVHYTLVTNPT